MTWHWQPNADDTKLGRSADLLEGRKALQRSWQIESMGWDNLIRFNKAKCWVLPLGHNHPLQHCRGRGDWKLLSRNGHGGAGDEPACAPVAKKVMASWLVSAVEWPAGSGKWLSCSSWHWWGHTSSTGFSSEFTFNFTQNMYYFFASLSK